MGPVLSSSYWIYLKLKEMALESEAGVPCLGMALLIVGGLADFDMNSANL